MTTLHLQPSRDTSTGTGRTSPDYLIGAHAASPPRRLVTENVKDFSHLPRVVDVWDAVNNNF